MPKPHLIIADNAADLAQKAAPRIAAAIRRRPRLTLIPATGHTPLETYAELTRLRHAGQVDASQTRIFQLDEYVGLSPDDIRALYRWMREVLLEPLAIPSAQVTRLAGEADDLTAECRRYDRAVMATGGIDLAVLGLGPNGHLGFNEPPSDEHAPTRPVRLSEASLRSNAAYWGGRDQVPREALTAGMSTLLAARQIILLVRGSHKRQILRRVLSGPITPEVPASYLQRAECCTVIADRAARPET